MLNLLLRDQIAEILAQESKPPPPDDDMPEVDMSPRAQQQREILRIAASHHWGMGAVRHFLDTRNSAYLSDLTEPQLDDLYGRMCGYVDAAMTGCDSIDTLPAY